MKLKQLVLAVTAALAAPAVLALPIAGLVNTGAGLPDNSQDSNYVLTVTQGSTVLSSNQGYVADQAGWPDASPWIGANGLSKWLTPFEDESTTLDAQVDGIYKWTLSFDLTGADLSATSFSGRWAADNIGTVLLNGINIGSSLGFSSWSGFSAASGFIAGINTLEFLVTNQAQSSGNPTGLRVEFLQTSTSSVPEPESYALLLASLGVLGAVSRRRAK